MVFCVLAGFFIAICWADAAPAAASVAVPTAINAAAKRAIM
jgi:hypothetical protein